MTTTTFVPGGYDKTCTSGIILALAGQPPTMELLLTWLDNDRISQAALGALVRTWHRGDAAVTAAVHTELHACGVVDMAGGVLPQPARRVPRQSEPESTAVAKGSVVYYLRRPDGAVKIGFSKNLTHRIERLEKVYGPLTLLAKEPGGKTAETARHRRFQHLQITDAPSWQGTEWFRPAGELLAHIEAVGGAR